MHASLLETFSFTIVHPVSPQCIGVRQAERAETLSKMNKAADSFCAYSCWSVQLGLHGVRAPGWDGLHG